jgi:hypothetical protein
MKVRQVWVRYDLWEDYLNGMWRKATPEEQKTLLPIAVDFTGNVELYGAAMKEVIMAWPNTMLNSLTNPSLNKRAFLGHCACCYKIQVPESVTRAAWWMLTEQQRALADEAAQIVIDSWQIAYLNKFQLKIPFPNET